MKHFLSLCILFITFGFVSNAQVFEPVKWTVEAQKVSDSEYNLIYKATIDNHWHLYSQNLPEGGALPTEFVYDSIQQVNNYELVGKAIESESITEYDKVFEMDLTYFESESKTFKLRTQDY